MQNRKYLRYGLKNIKSKIESFSKEGEDFWLTYEDYILIIDAVGEWKNFKVDPSLFTK